VVRLLSALGRDPQLEFKERERYTVSKSSVVLSVQSGRADLEHGIGVILQLQLLIESDRCSVRILRILLGLLPHVEDRTIPTRTQHILEPERIP